MKTIKPCQRCQEYDHGRCRIGICATVRCLMIAKGLPLPPTPASAVGPTPTQATPAAQGR